MTIEWESKEFKLKDLKPYERNPRQITEVQYKKLVKSLKQDGYHTPIKATQDGRVIGGHQRLKALKEIGYDKITILVPSRDLTEEQFKRIMLRDNVNNGEWDMDILSADFDLEALRDFGLEEVMKIAPFDDEDESHEKGKHCVRCPECDNVFETKGNKA